ncbi:hypothetical protein GLOIN_2v1874593 [Rhizophagus irregularis DAOM 181602=DAOM 197198]|nr:hypothetical protein GLOIN_2v1874593 [Rhizophagus irregularis DAOM 181602=DAOM 197198]
MCRNIKTFSVLQSHVETNPLALSTIQKANSTVKPKKSFSKYKYGEMVIECKHKRDKDAMGNIFGAGHKQVYVV